MPISKQTLKQIAQQVPGGKLSNGLSPAAEEMINKIVDKLHALLFKKGTSAELSQVEARLAEAARQSSFIDSLARRGLREAIAPYPVPLITIKKMIREHAGDIKVPDNTLRVMSNLLHDLLLEVLDNASRKMSSGVAVLEAKDLKASLADPSNGNYALAQLVAKARGLRKLSSKKKSASKKRRSASKKRRSASKKKRSSKKCVSGKSPVRGHKRSDGKRVKAHCRKSSTRK
jgi:hypothetical protein